MTCHVSIFGGVCIPGEVVSLSVSLKRQIPRRMNLPTFSLRISHIAM